MTSAALMEIDQVAVKAADLALAREGNVEARKRIAERLEGEILYCHSMPVEDDEIIVTLRELEDLNLILRVTVHTRW